MAEEEDSVYVVGVYFSDFSRPGTFVLALGEYEVSFDVFLGLHIGV